MDDAARDDVIIAGGGPVGGALALLARERGIAVRMIDREAVPAALRSAAPFRPVALSHASAQLLAARQVVAPANATAITHIHVSQRGSFGRTVLDAAEHGLPALGYVVDGSVLADAMRSRCAALAVRGEVTAWQGGDDDIVVEWNDGSGAPRRSRARLLVLADGGEQQQPARDYGQQAIVCTIRSALPHRGTAYERFTADGPLALLPCGDQYAVVWSLDRARAQQLLAAGDAAFAAALQETFGWRQGRLYAPGTRLAFPLVLRRGERMRQRVVSIGNAAQTLHPVAGQGLNLGLRDAMALADELAAAPGDDLGSDAFVKRYSRRRLADRAATIGVTDILARAFAVQTPPAPMLRAAALVALDAFAPARKFFARRMILGARGL